GDGGVLEADVHAADEGSLRPRDAERNGRDGGEIAVEEDRVVDREVGEADGMAGLGNCERAYGLALDAHSVADVVQTNLTAEEVLDVFDNEIGVMEMGDVRGPSGGVVDGPD